MAGKGILDQISDLAKDFEKRTGAPPLTKLVQTIEKLPDERRLNLVKEVLVAADRVSQNAPELDKVISLINEINSLPIDKLVKLEKLLKRVEKIMKSAPDELLSFLTSLREE